MAFNEIWQRVEQETRIRSQKKLAEELSISRAVVSKWKNLNMFPVEWAYRIAQKYGLSTEWIMTGEGPKRLSEAGEDKSQQEKEQPRGMIEEWGRFLVESSQEARVVLRLSRESTDFAEWLRQQEEAEQIKKSQAA